MERRAARIQEVGRRQRHELSCMWGLFSVMESCHSRTGRKLISNGRPVDKQTTDYPRKLEQRASFDEECRRIQLQNEADLETAGDMLFEKYNTKQTIVKGHGQAKSDSECFDLFVETHKRTKGNSRETYQSSLFHLDNNELPSGSADISLDELTLATVLRAVCSQNHAPEHSVRTSAKEFADQMFIHKQLVSRNGSSSNVFAKTEKETVKSILEAGECEGLGPSSSFENARNAFVGEKGKMNRNLRRNSSEGGFVARPSEKIVILKPAKYSENVTCHCSSLQSHKKPSKKVSAVKHTPFSFREMKRKLKHTFGGPRKELSESSNVETEENLHHELDIKTRWGYDISAPGKSDSSCVRILSSKEDFDVILEAKKHLSARFNNLNALETATNENNSWKTLARILASPERDIWPISPTRDRKHGSGSAQMSFSPYNDSPTFGESSSKIPSERERAFYSPIRTKNEVHDKYGSNSVQIPSPYEQEQEQDIHSDDITSNGKSKIVEMDSNVRPQLNYSEVPSEINGNDLTRTMQRTERTESQKADENDSLSENEASTSTVNDGIKYQDEHQSPVSVLEPFFIEDANSPLSVTLQNGKSGDGHHQLKPRCLDFKECSFESSYQDPQIDANSCMQEQDHLSQYVHLVLQASCLNWDQLAEIMSPDEELLDSFLFDEVEFLSPTDCYFDPKLLFDRINEVLLEIYHCHLRFPQRQSFVEPKVRSVPLAELVTDEIMKEAEFFLLPWTEKRTLDQLVLNDVAKHRSWMSDVRVDTDEIVNEISEGFVDGFILDVLVEFYNL